MNENWHIILLAMEKLMLVNKEPDHKARSPKLHALNQIHGT